MLNLIQSLAASVRPIADRMRIDEKGQTFVEYALLIGGVSIGLLGAFGLLTGHLTDFVNGITF
jgi:Flp pilus assembly pilin Flp